MNATASPARCWAILAITFLSSAAAAQERDVAPLNRLFHDDFKRDSRTEYRTKGADKIVWKAGALHMAGHSEVDRYFSQIGSRGEFRFGIQFDALPADGQATTVLLIHFHGAPVCIVAMHQSNRRGKYEGSVGIHRAVTRRGRTEIQRVRESTTRSCSPAIGMSRIATACSRCLETTSRSSAASSRMVTR